MGSMTATDQWESVENSDSKRQLSDYQPPLYQAQNYPVVDLKGRPVDKSKTGTWKAAPSLFALNFVDAHVGSGIIANLVPYLADTMHQSISKASTITNDCLGTSVLLAVLGGFLADSYLGSFYTLCAGGIFAMMGLGLLTASTTFSYLQPPACSPNGPCKPAGGRYMGPLYAALYTIALGSGLVKPNTVSLGGDQFDDSNPKEKKRSVHFYSWFFFVTNIGFLLAFTLGVYLQDDVSRSWGYGYFLMSYGICFLLFILGTTKFRHKMPTGSFITRGAQVLVASFRKWKVVMPENPESDLYSPGPTASLSFKLSHTNKLSTVSPFERQLGELRAGEKQLEHAKFRTQIFGAIHEQNLGSLNFWYIFFAFTRFLDKAAIVDEEDKQAIIRGRPDPWRLCSVTQVEESKRLVQLVPICLTTACVTLLYSQLATFTVQQGGTLDRRLGKHFVIPPASLGVLMELVSLLSLPVYDKILFPFARRYTKSPYGFAPLQRLGASLAFSIITMICAALVERKRLTYVRELHLEALSLGAYALPMEFWYLLPQFFFAAQAEIFLYVASYEFYYHEVAGTTHSVGSSFTYTASASGNYFSTIIVNITNHVTRHAKGGAWLEGQLNNGGLEKFYWLLAVFIGVSLILFLVAAYFYEYKHDWYSIETSQPERQIPLSRNRIMDSLEHNAKRNPQ